MHTINKVKKIFQGYHENIYVLLVSWIILGYITNGADPFLPNYIVALGGKESYIGMIYGTGTLAQIPVLLLGGLIGDYYGRKNVIILFTWLVAFNYLIYALAPNWTIILVGIVVGSLVGIYRPSLQAIMGDSLKTEERGRGTLLVTLIPRLLSLPAAYIMGYLISLYGDLNPLGYKYVFILATVLAMLAAIIRWFFLKETLLIKSRKKIRKILKETVSDLAGIRIIPIHTKRIIIFHMIVQFGWSLSMGYLIRYAFKKGVDSSQYGLFLMIASASAIIVGLASMPIIDKYDPRDVMALGYIASALGFLSFYTGNFFFIATGLVIIQSSWNFRRAGFQKYFMDGTPSTLRARAVSLNAIIASIASTLGYLSASLLLTISSDKISLLLLGTSTIAFLGGITVKIILPKIYKAY